MDKHSYKDRMPDVERIDERIEYLCDQVENLWREKRDLQDQVDRLEVRLYGPIAQGSRSDHPITGHPEEIDRRVKEDTT